MLFVVMMRIIQNKAAGSEGIRAKLDARVNKRHLVVSFVCLCSLNC